MQIQQHRNTPHFGALHIANAGDLKLYKLTEHIDKGYLKNLPQEVRIDELLPNLTPDGAKRWQEMLEYAVFMAQEPDNITLLETLGNKPCGIITYELGKNSSLDCICTWPIETGKKVYLAGKTLFYCLFEDFLANRGSKIKLEAVTDGAVDTVKKYSELGFKKTSDAFTRKTLMEANSFSVKAALERLKQLIDFQYIEPEKVKLADELYF